MTQDSQKKHFIEALAKGVRRDGRALQEFRKITVEYGVSSTSHGSARVVCGEAEIIAGIKMEVGTPYSDTPNEGSLMVMTELLPLAHRKFEGGPPGIDSIEAARVVDRTIRESGAIDLKQLCIKEGEKMWTVIVDIMPVSYDGNMIDLGVIAAMAAIKDARLPVIDENFRPDYEKLTEERLPVKQSPLAVTVFKYGEHLLIDPTEVEERLLDSRLTVGLLADGNLCAIQKGGEGALTMEHIEAMIELAKQQNKILREVIA